MRTQFPKLVVMARDEVATFVAGPDDVCISITDSTSAPATLSANYRDVLRVQFGDLPWPEFSEHPAQITDAIADEIVRFVDRHRDARRLVIHCAAGASRSPSTAMALSVLFHRRWWFPKWFRPEWRQERRVVNPNVFNAIGRAFARAFPDSPAVAVTPARAERPKLPGCGREKAVAKYGTTDLTTSENE